MREKFGARVHSVQLRTAARAAALHLLSAAARPRNLRRKLVNESDPRVETSTPPFALELVPYSEQ